MEKLLNYSGLEKYNDLIHDELDQKANIDGYYESLGSGTADQLSSNIYEEDNEPYQFRTSGGSIDIGDREYDTLVGGSVAWNQLINDTWTASSANVSVSVSDGVITATSNGSIGRWDASNNAPDVVIGHKYLLSAYMKGDHSGFDVAMQNFTPLTAVTSTVNGWTSITKIGTVIEGAGYHNVQLQFGTNYASFANGEKIQGKSVMLIDLTQLFGSTIADYIYTLEQGTAGAGVAFFRKYFPKPYYPYDAGTIKSVEGVSAHKTVGFNAWDEEWESGGINNNGTNNNDSRIRSKNYIKVVPNTSYYVRVDFSAQFDGTLMFYAYDINKTFLQMVGWRGGNTPNLVTPNECYYVRFMGTLVRGTAYTQNDICINLSWDGERNGEYEPYVEHSYPLDDSLTLRGIPKVANGKLYYDGDTYESDGDVTRKYGIVDLGTLTWTLSATNRFYATLPTSAKPTGSYDVKSNLMCVKYESVTMNQVYANVKGIAPQSMNGGTVYVYDTAYSTKEEIETGLNGVYLVYELATPTTETADPYQSPQIVDDFGTEEYVTTSIVPVGHYTQYMANLKAKLEMSPDSPNGAGDYIVRQTNGENEYVSLASNATIQNIIARLEALEGGGE